MKQDDRNLDIETLHAVDRKLRILSSVYTDRINEAKGEAYSAQAHARLGEALANRHGVDDALDLIAGMISRASQD